jgi:hypothetical protein
MQTLLKIILSIALASSATCYAQQLRLECKLDRWMLSAYSALTPILIVRNLQFGQLFLVDIDTKKGSAIASYENYKLAEATGERYVIIGDIDAFSFNRDTGQVAWALLDDDKRGGTPVATGSCEARQIKKKF